MPIIKNRKYLIISWLSLLTSILTMTSVVHAQPSDGVNIVSGYVEARHESDPILYIRKGPKTAQSVENATSSDRIQVRVDVADWEIYGPGSELSGRVFTSEGHLRMEQIWPKDRASEGLIATLGKRLRHDTNIRGHKAFRATGERLPEFALWDQSAKVFPSRELRGKYVVINFVFTRCTMPNMCPASTRKMKELEDALRAASITSDEAILISITLDPEFETPGVNRAYAATYGLDPAYFRYLTGPSGIVDDLKLQLGLLAEKDPQLVIKHTLMTVLADPEGKIIYQIPGSQWSPEDFLNQIQRHRNKNSKP